MKQHESYEPDPFQELAQAKAYTERPLRPAEQPPRQGERQIIRPQLNQPTIVQLSGQEPSEVKGLDDKPQWLYSVNGNRGMMYASHIGHAAIQETGARQGDTIRILRSYGKWKVEICEDEPGRPAGGRPDSALQSKPPANGNAYREPAQNGNGWPNQEPQRAQRPAPPEVQAAATRAAEMSAQPKQVFPLAEEFVPFLRAAAIACIDIEREATNRGRKLEFSPRDISAIASTIYIQHAKGMR